MQLRTQPGERGCWLFIVNKIDDVEYLYADIATCDYPLRGRFSPRWSRHERLLSSYVREHSFVIVDFGDLTSL